LNDPVVLQTVNRKIDHHHVLVQKPKQCFSPGM